MFVAFAAPLFYQVPAARIALEIPAEHLHPMHQFICESPVIDREAILGRDASGEVTPQLLHVVGVRLSAHDQSATEGMCRVGTTECGFHLLWDYYTLNRWH